MAGGWGGIGSGVEPGQWPGPHQGLRPASLFTKLVSIALARIAFGYTPVGAWYNSSGQVYELEDELAEIAPLLESDYLIPSYEEWLAESRPRNADWKPVSFSVNAAEYFEYFRVSGHRLNLLLNDSSNVLVRASAEVRCDGDTYQIRNIAAAWTWVDVINPKVTESPDQWLPTRWDDGERMARNIDYFIEFSYNVRINFSHDHADILTIQESGAEP